MRNEIAILLCLLLFALPLVGCGNAVTPNKKVQAAERVDARLVEGNTDFAFRLFEQLQEPTGDANTFFSPTSIAFALSMVYNGAAGETKTEMAQAMGIESLTLEELNKANADLLSILQNPDSKVETNIANSLWPDDDAHMMADFMQRNRDYYDAEVETLDYAQSDAYAIINNWVEEKTEGKIKDLFEPLDADTRLVLVNALYFNGEWTEAFAEELTQSADFTLNDGSTKSVPLMHKDTTLASLEEDSFNAVRLPYGKERLSMYVFVPTENLADFYQQLSAENWEAWMSSFTEREVQVFLPRFKAEYKQELNDALQQLGMKEAFNPSLANFSTMAEEELFVSKVIHQAYIDVHEKGTEAAAATGVEMRLTSVQDDPFTVRADQPFFFAIRDDLTDTILFMGEVTNP